MKKYIVLSLTLFTSLVTFCAAGEKKDPTTVTELCHVIETKKVSSIPDISIEETLATLRAIHDNQDNHSEESQRAQFALSKFSKFTKYTIKVQQAGLYTAILQASKFSLTAIQAYLDGTESSVAKTTSPAPSSAPLFLERPFGIDFAGSYWNGDRFILGTNPSRRTRTPVNPAIKEKIKIPEHHRDFVARKK